MSFEVEVKPDEVELQGITIHKALNFKKHIENLCRTAQYKLHVLRQIRKYLTLDKTKLLCNHFINSQFNYAPLIWMFCHKTTYSKTQKIHHKTLKVIYQSDVLQLTKITLGFLKVVFSGGSKFKKN